MAKLIQKKMQNFHRNLLNSISGGTQRVWWKDTHFFSSTRLVPRFQPLEIKSQTVSVLRDKNASSPVPDHGWLPGLCDHLLPLLSLMTSWCVATLKDKSYLDWKEIEENRIIEIPNGFSHSFTLSSLLEIWMYIW